MKQKTLLLVLTTALLGLSISTTEDDRFICLEKAACSYNKERLLSSLNTNLNQFYELSQSDKRGDSLIYKTEFRKTTRFDIEDKDFLDGLSNFKLDSVRKSNLKVDFYLKTSFPESIILSDTQQSETMNTGVQIDYKTEGIIFESRKVDKIDRNVDKFVSFGYVTFFLSESKVYSTRLGEENVKYQLFSDNTFFEAPEDMETLFNVENIFKVKTPPNTMDIFGVLTTEEKLYLFETRGSFKEYSVKFMFYFELREVIPDSLNQVLLDSEGRNIILCSSAKITVIFPREQPNSKQFNAPDNFRIVSTIYSNSTETEVNTVSTNQKTNTSENNSIDQSQRKPWNIPADLLDLAVMPNKIYSIAAGIGVYEYDIRKNILILLYKHSFLSQIEISWNKEAKVSVMDIFVNQSKTKDIYEILIEFVFEGGLTKFNKVYYSNKFTQFSKMVVQNGMIVLPETEFGTITMIKSGIAPGIQEQTYQLKSRFDLISSSDGPIPVLESDSAYSYVFNEPDGTYQIGDIKHRNEFIDVLFPESGQYEIEYFKYKEHCDNKGEKDNVCRITNKLLIDVENTDKPMGEDCIFSQNCITMAKRVELTVCPKTLPASNSAEKSVCFTENYKTCSELGYKSKICYTKNGNDCLEEFFEREGRSCRTYDCATCSESGGEICMTRDGESCSTVFTATKMLLLLLLALIML